MTLFLECDGEVSDWIDNRFTIQVDDGNYYVAGENLPRGWRNQIVLIDYDWKVAHDISEISSQRVTV